MRFSSGSELLILFASIVVSAFLTGCGGGGGGGGHAPRPINGDTQALHGSEGGSDAAFNAVGDGLAVWVTDSGSEYGRSKVLCSRYSASDRRWSEEQELGTFGVYPCVAASATGFMVAWMTYDPLEESSGNPYQGVSARSHDGRTWGPEVRLTSGVEMPWSESSSPRIASDGTGYAVVWVHASGGSDDLHASIYAGGSWSAPEVLDVESGDVRSPVLASGGSGSYAVAWTQSDGVAESIHAGVFSGGTWARALLELGSGEAGSPRIAASNLGYAVTWAQSDGVRDNVHASMYIGSGWLDPALVSIPLETGTGDAGEPQIASNGAGYAVVWRQRDGTSFDSILANVFNGLTWSGEQSLETAEGDASGPRIASNGSGYAAAWIQEDGEGSPYASVYSSGAWSGAPSPLRSSGGDSRGLSICRSGSNYAAAWLQQDAATSSLYAAVHGGSGWGSAAPLEHSADPARGGAVTSRGTSGCVASWFQWDGQRQNFFASQYESGSWSAETALVRGSHRAACDAPRIAANAAGDVVAVWRQFRPGADDFSASAVLAGVYRAGRWGAPFLVAETCEDPPVLATDGTGFMVVWSQDDAGGGCNLYARIFDGNAWGGSTAVECTSGIAHKPEIASSGSGYSIVWEQMDPGGIWNVYASSYSGGAWGPPEALESSDLDARDAVMASDGTGYAAAWRQSDGAVDRIFANNYSGAWVPAAATALAATGGASQDPGIASSGSGYALTWAQDDGAGHVNVHANIYNPAEGAWNPANTLLVDALDGDAELPRIAPVGTGYAIAWSQDDGSARSVYASIYAGAWSPPRTLDSSAVEALNPRIASDGASCAAVWLTFDGASAHTYYSRFSGGTWGPETPLGDSFQFTAFPDVAAIPGVGYGAVYMQRFEADPTVWDIFAELGF